MKLLMVGMGWFPNQAGGLNRYFYEQVQAMPGVGISGDAYVTDLKPGQTAPLTLHAFAHEKASNWERQQGARRAIAEALKADPDVINTHFALYAQPWLSQLPDNKPLVVHFHGPWADEIAAEGGGLKTRLRVFLAARIERQVYARAHRIITLSDAFQKIAIEHYCTPANKMRIVRGGVNTRLYSSAPERVECRRRLGWPEDRPILVAVRRLARRMGLENLIDAITIIRRDYPNILLLIGGKGAIKEELEARIQQNNLQDNVRLLGFVPDENLPLAYAAADIAVVPTVALEGFGLVTVEALASGTAVMGTPTGGTAEILRDLNPQLLFSGFEPDRLAEGLLAALSGKITLPDRAECRAFAYRYDWAEVAPRIRAVFEEAMQEVRNGR